MNNSINYSGYVDMFLNSSDDIEHYGYEAISLIAGDPLSGSDANHMLHRENLLAEPWDD